MPKNDFFISKSRSRQSSIRMSAADEFMVIKSNGTIEYFDNHGQTHRTCGPVVIYQDGDIEYWIHGNLHRIGAPAYMGEDGAESWWEHGQCHRIGGPARTYADGTHEWWLNGDQVDPL